jgi:hypothetical protein
VASSSTARFVVAVFLVGLFLLLVAGNLAVSGSVSVLVSVVVVVTVVVTVFVVVGCFVFRVVTALVVIDVADSIEAAIAFASTVVGGVSVVDSSSHVKILSLLSSCLLSFATCTGGSQADPINDSWGGGNSTVQSRGLKAEANKGGPHAPETLRVTTSDAGSQPLEEKGPLCVNN